MILTALDHYAAACNRLDLMQRPVAWAAHFDSRDTLLGTLSVPEVRGDRHLGYVCHGVTAPFGCSTSVQTTFCIVDAQASPGQQRSVFVSRLSALDEGVNMTHWRISYEMDDRGRIDFGPPDPAAAAPNAMFAALSVIVNQRLSGAATYYFDDAFRASARFLELLAAGKLREAGEQ